MNFKKILNSILPGIFLLGFNIGTGSVTAMAKAGAGYGMSLLWTIFISCVITYFLILIFGRYTLVTGETALYAFRQHIHPAVGIFFILALGTAVCGSVMGVMGIIADICAEWSKQFISGGIDSLYFAIIFITFIYIIFWNGRTGFFQKSLAIIVAVMSASFIINFFVLSPPFAELLTGMIPNIPQTNDNPLLIIASMVGTTVYSGLFIIRTTLVKEAGWTIRDDKLHRKDALVSAGLMFIISASVMAAAAGTLYVNNIALTNSAEMVSLLEPLAGSFTTAIFMTGFVAAGLSSQFPNVLLLPWLICDYFNIDRDMTKWKYRGIVMIISLLGLIVPLFQAPPVMVMIASQAFNTILLPVTVLCIIILGNKKDVMQKYRFSTWTNFFLVLIMMFAIYMSVNGIRGLIAAV